MLKYNILVWINDGSQVILPVQYENDYNLRKDIVNIGINGVLQKNGEIYEYYPPHKINKIEAKEDKEV